MEPDTIGKVIGLLGAIAVAANQALKFFQRPRPRLQLKEDLEILNAMPDSIAERELLERHISACATEIYTKSHKPGRFEQVDWANVIVFGFMFIGFTYWTFHLSWGGFSWWSVLTGLFALSSSMTLVQEFKIPPEMGVEPTPEDQPASEGSDGTQPPEQ